MFFTKKKESEPPQIIFNTECTTPFNSEDYENIVVNQEQNVNYNIERYEVKNEEGDTVENDEGDRVDNDEDDDTVENDEEGDTVENDEEDDEEDEHMFVIVIDGEPYFHNTSQDKTRDIIDSIAKKYILKDAENLDKFHTTHIRYRSLDEIDIIRNFDFVLFSYNYVVHSIRIHRTIHRF
jgi:hypothetical protein